ncbi:MAG: IS5 family transposase [Acidimicrobiales bacterium]|nr:IS5 family transposase [Acidimicrobiales bacterium]
MLALHPRVVDAVWDAVEALIPPHVPPPHPLGCHRRRIPDRICFEGILRRLVTGCSWDVAGRISGAGETTLRRRRDEWEAAGVFDRLCTEALNGYHRIIGVDLSEVAIDGSQHKAPFGGEGTGPNPTDRGKSGWKWSIATDRHGIPIGWAIDGANRHDCALFAPTLASLSERDLLADIETLHLDRGYDNGVVRRLCASLDLELVCARKRKKGTATVKKPVPHGLRWPVERTNSWLSNFGQLRRNTDRYTRHRLAQLQLAIALILTVKLIKWADRWNTPQPST